MRQVAEDEHYAVSVLQVAGTDRHDDSGGFMNGLETVGLDSLEQKPGRRGLF